MPNAHRDHLSLLYDIGELAGLVRESTDIPNLLDRTVTTISQHLRAEVCSIYLYDEETRELVPMATKGLDRYQRLRPVRSRRGPGERPGCLRLPPRASIGPQNAQAPWRCRPPDRQDMSVCGEMAFDHDLMPFLLGTSIRTLSVPPQHLPQLQRRITSLSLGATETYAAQLLAESSLAGVQVIIRSAHPLDRTLP